jgi:hypothetical protein
MDVTLIELESGRRFVEQSKTLAMKRVAPRAHDRPRRRRLRRDRSPHGGGSIASLTPLIERVIGLFFDHRHRQIRQTSAGWRSAAKTMKRATLELGDEGPQVVLDDANLDEDRSLAPTPPARSPEGFTPQTVEA